MNDNEYRDRIADWDLGAVLLESVTEIVASVPVTEQLLAEHGARFVRDGYGDAVKITWA